MGPSASKLTNDQDHDTEGYDFVLDIDSIAGAATGWPVLFSEQYFLSTISPAIKPSSDPSQALNDIIRGINLNDNKPILAVLGLFNRGKTYVINQLAQANLPSGRKVKTKGLSFFMPTKARDFTFLDTAGSSSPVTSTDEAMLIQRKNTEQFQDDVVLGVADIVVLLVTELSWPDQQYIECVKSKINKQRLFIVHNFMESSTEKDLLLMWQKCVLSTTDGLVKGIVVRDGTRRHVLCCSFNDDYIYHFCLANGNSEFGSQFNQGVFEAMRSILLGIAPKPKGSEILNILCVQIGLALKDYCKGCTKVDYKFNPNTDEMIYEKEERRKCVDKDIPEDLKWSMYKTFESPPHTLKMVAEGDLTLKRNAISYEGNRIVVLDREGKFTPKFDQIEVPDKDDQGGGLVFAADMPGFSGQSSIEICFDPDTLGEIVIKGKRVLEYNAPGNKALTEYQHAKEGKLLCERTDGEFVRRLRFDPTRFQSEVKEWTNEDGVFTFFLPFKAAPKPISITKKGK